MAVKTHGETHSPLHRLWGDMKNRCYNPRNQKYPVYGGRGICVDEPWRSSYEAFRDWALKNGYEKGLSIDRIDVNKNYSPDNCRFATQKTQQNNRTNNHLLTYAGKTQTMSQWASELGFTYKALEHRINRGWSVERALTTPLRRW